MISLALATLDDSELNEMYAVCSTNRRYWQYSGDLDPENMTREEVEDILRGLAVLVDCELLVARDVTGTLVGIVHVLRRHPVDGHPWIGLLLVDGRLHRQGHGTAVVKTLEKRFSREGARGVRLGILENNVEAQQFWATLGYREIDRRPDLAKHRPTLVMHKDLCP